MNHDPRPRTGQRFTAEQLLRLALALGALTASLALALYAYLGTFSRYGSDDYCLSAFFLQEDLGAALIQRYFSASGRYTNILFIGLVDQLFGWYNVAILPPLMLVLFVLGAYLFLKEIAEWFELGWSRGLVLFLALLLVYFSIIQVPDLYETLYWRAGMTSHFAPVILIPFFGAFLLGQIRHAGKQAPSPWILAACFAIPFVIGGFSEPPTALLITVLALGIAAAGWRGDVRRRRSVLVLLGWSLAGALAALLVMALAPANSIRLETPPPPLPELVRRVISYPYYFIVDTLRTLPIPTLVSLAVPALLFYVKYAHSPQSLSQAARRRLGILLVLVLVLTYLFVAASFAPSAYGQSFPAPRVRFIGRVLLTGAFLVEGALLGRLAAGAEGRILRSPYLRGFASFMLILLLLYPLRTSWRLAPEIPVYRERAAAWDARDAQIRAQKAQGIQDVTVTFLRMERTQDLGDRVNFRLNRCAAVLYDVNTILALPPRSNR